jgi:hypothetical protein
VLQVAPLVAGQRPGRQVELHVPATQLGLEIRGTDGLQDRRPGERRGQLLVDEVELDLDTVIGSSSANGWLRSISARVSRQLRTFAR